VWDRTFAISMYSSTVKNIVSGLSFSGFFLGGKKGREDVITINISF